MDHGNISQGLRDMKFEVRGAIYNAAMKRMEAGKPVLFLNVGNPHGKELRSRCKVLKSLTLELSVFFRLCGSVGPGPNHFPASSECGRCSYLI